MMQGCDKDPWGIPVASKLRGSVWGFPCRSLQHPSACLDRRMLSCIPETSLCNLSTHTNNILHTSLPCPACFCHASHTQLTQTLQHDHRNKAGHLRLSTHGLRHACQRTAACLTHVAAVATTSCHAATACAECCKRLVPQLPAPKLKCTVAAACCLSCAVPPLSLMRSTATPSISCVWRCWLSCCCRV